MASELMVRMLSVGLFTASSSLLLHSAHFSGLEYGCWSDLDVLLRSHSHHERRDVHELFTNSNMSLPDQNSGVMNGACTTNFILSDQSLESSLHELVESKTEYVIELLLILLQQTKLDNSSDESVSLEQSSGILFVKGHEFSGGLSQLCKSKLHSPDFSLASQTVSSDDSELVNESIPIEWFSRGLGSFPIISVFLWHVLLMLLSLNSIESNNKKHNHLLI